MSVCKALVSPRDEAGGGWWLRACQLILDSRVPEVREAFSRSLERAVCECAQIGYRGRFSVLVNVGHWKARSTRLDVRNLQGTGLQLLFML
jgi:hypothetical protein